MSGRPFPRGGSGAALGAPAGQLRPVACPDPRLSRYHVEHTPRLPSTPCPATASRQGAGAPARERQPDRGLDKKGRLVADALRVPSERQRATADAHGHPRPRPASNEIEV